MHRRFVFVLASLAACKPVDVSSTLWNVPNVSGMTTS